jgi:prenylcysteine oxidase / farnesylcysteine lyase
LGFLSNLPYIHGLGMLFSMASEGAVFVAGGNWQIFEKMIQKSNATVYRETAVAAIELDSTKDPFSPQAKYLITTKSTKANEEHEGAHPIQFDNVVIATPWQYSNIEASEEVLQHAIDEIPYAMVYVTIFISPFKLSPIFFGMEPGSKAPSTIMTTLGNDERPMPGAEGVGRSGFYSISTLRTITNPNTLKDEYVYKILSPHVITSDFLSGLLGIDVPDAVTTPSKFNSTNVGEGVDPVSWYHKQVFHAYPIPFPRVTFQDPILRGGLYYTSGIESFASTMEMSSLMGMNVARLIANDFLQLKHGNAAAETELRIGEDYTQVVMDPTTVVKDGTGKFESDGVWEL